MTKNQGAHADAIASLSSLPKDLRMQGDVREQVRADVVRAYEAGCSVRAIADALDRSYGTIHRLLEESDVEMRSRGGRVATMERAS